jgi:hypothetical protein
MLPLTAAGEETAPHQAPSKVRVFLLCSYPSERDQVTSMASTRPKRPSPPPSPRVTSRRRLACRPHSSESLFVCMKKRLTSEQVQRRRPPEPLPLLDQPRPRLVRRHQALQGLGPSVRAILSALRADSESANSQAIEKQWGSLDAFQAAFNGACAAIQGSGWGWLGKTESGGLVIQTTKDQVRSRWACKDDTETRGRTRCWRPSRSLVSIAGRCVCSLAVGSDLE